VPEEKRQSSRQSFLTAVARGPRSTFAR
jgi:hypothetical protein